MQVILKVVRHISLQSQYKHQCHRWCFLSCWRADEVHPSPKDTAADVFPTRFTSVLLPSFWKLPSVSSIQLILSRDLLCARVWKAKFFVFMIIYQTQLTMSLEGVLLMRGLKLRATQWPPRITQLLKAEPWFRSRSEELLKPERSWRKWRKLKSYSSEIFSFWGKSSCEL